MNRKKYVGLLTLLAVPLSAIADEPVPLLTDNPKIETIDSGTPYIDTGADIAIAEAQKTIADAKKVATELYAITSTDDTGPRIHPALLREMTIAKKAGTLKHDVVFTASAGCKGTQTSIAGILAFVTPGNPETWFREDGTLIPAENVEKLKALDTVIAKAEETIVQIAAASEVTGLEKLEPDIGFIDFSSISLFAADTGQTRAFERTPLVASLE